MAEAFPEHWQVQTPPETEYCECTCTLASAVADVRAYACALVCPFKILRAAVAVRACSELLASKRASLSMLACFMLVRVCACPLSPQLPLLAPFARLTSTRPYGAFGKSRTNSNK